MCVTAETTLVTMVLSCGVAFGTEGPCHVCPYSIQSPAAALCIHCESALKQKLDKRRALRTLALETWAWTLLSPASLQGNADFTGLPLQSPSVTRMSM